MIGDSRALAFFTGHTGTPLVDAAMVFVAENLVYLVPVALLYWWFAPEAKRIGSRFGLGLASRWSATETGKAESVFVAVTIVTSLAISFAFGQLHSHPAPYMAGYETLLVEAPENSFPSQHTTVVFAFAWPLLYLRERWRDGLVALFLAALVGIGRVYVGVHYPVDVVGAVGASLLGVALTYVARDAVMGVGRCCVGIEDRLKTALVRVL